MESPFETLWRHARRQEGRAALVDDAGALSWQDLIAQVDGLCLALVRQGMRSGRGVGLMLQPSRHLALAVLAVLRGRGVTVPLPPEWAAPRLLSMAQASRIEILIYDAAHEGVARSLAQERGLRSVIRVGEGAAPGELVWGDLVRTDAAGARFPELSLDGVFSHHWLPDRSGCLRAGLVTLRGLLLSAQSAGRLHRFTPDDRHLSLLPAQIRPVDQVLRPLLSGGCLVLHRSGGLRALAAVLQDQSVSVLLAPAFYFRLLATWVEAAGLRLPALRVLESVGLAGKRLQRNVSRTLGVELSLCWGTLESYGSVLGPEPAAGGVVRQHQPCPGVLVQIVTPAGNPVLGEDVGALCMRSGMAVPAALDIQGERSPVERREGWVATGWAARHTLSGEIELLGPLDESYQREGKTVYPREVELCLESHRAVEQSAVLSFAQSSGPVLALAVVRVQPGSEVTAAALGAHLSRRLRPAQLPDRILLAERLPAEPLGDVDRVRLRERLRRVFKQA